MASFDTAATNWATKVNIIDSVGDETKSVGIAVYVLNQQLWFLVSKAYKITKSSVSIVGDNAWHHYVFRFHQSGILVSVDGKSVTTRLVSLTTNNFYSKSKIIFT